MRSFKHKIRNVWLRSRYAACAGLVFVAASGSSLSILLSRPNIRSLEAAHVRLLGSSDKALFDSFEFDDQTRMYTLNSDLLPNEDLPAPVQEMMRSYGGGAEEETAKRNVAIELGEKAQDGMRLYDNNMKLSVRMTPQFKTGRGGVDEQGYFVYPLAGVEGSLVYTPQLNGLKEDVIIDTFTSSSLKFSYKLDLGEYLEARLEANGSIGVYSGAPELFGEMSFGSDKDWEQVHQSRKSAKKTNLVFTIPAPVINESDITPSEHIGRVYYDLNGSTVTVVAERLNELHYPIAIDPTLTVTSDSDFALGNNEDNVDYGSGSIKRAEPAGANLTWTSEDTLPQGRVSAGNGVAYNDFLYVAGGYIGTSTTLLSTVVRSPISSGALGAWTTSFTGSTYTTASAGATYFHAVSQYNGFIYLLGGHETYNNAATTNVVRYAKINSDGTLGTWAETTDLPVALARLSANAYDGYMYAVGGVNAAGDPVNTVYSAPLKADGSIGSWTSLTTLPTARSEHSSAIYNNVLYVEGGYVDDTLTESGEAYHVALNNDGTFQGSWVSYFLNAFNHGNTLLAYRGLMFTVGRNNGFSDDPKEIYISPLYSGATNRQQFWGEMMGQDRGYASAAVYKGYIYVVGGSVSTTTTEKGQIAPTGANSEWWALGNDMNRSQFGYAAYNGYVYTVGGGGASTTVSYAALGADGKMGAFANTSSLNVGRQNLCTTIYKGFVYALGGFDGAAATAAAEMAFIDSSDGSLNTWADFEVADLPGARQGPGCGVANNRIFVLTGSGNANIYYATPSVDGSIASWTTNTSTLPTSSPDLTTTNINAFFYGGRVYLQGTTRTELYMNDIATTCTNDCIDGSWTKVTADLSGNRSQAGFAVWNGYVYVAGGYDGSSTYDKSVQYGMIDPTDGDIDSWSTGEPLDIPEAGVRGLALYAHRGVLIYAGGFSGLGENYVQSSLIGNGGGGDTQTFTTSTALGTSVFSHCSVALNGYLYVIGGTETSTVVATVRKAPINADGTIGSWSTTTALSEARVSHACTVNKGHIYVVGGEDASANTEGTVMYAQPDTTTGDISSWTTDGDAVVTARDDHAITVYNNKLYIAGGMNGAGTRVSSVEYATINSDGSVSSWAATSSFTTAREETALAAANGYIYLTGGRTGASVWARDVQSAVINGDGTLGTWTVAGYMEIERADHTSIVLNGWLYIIGGRWTTGTVNSSLFNNVAAAPLEAGGKLGQFDTETTLSRYTELHATAYYKGYLYNSGGKGGATSGGTSANLTRVESGGIEVVSRIGKYSKLLDPSTNAQDYYLETLSYTGTILTGSKVDVRAKLACSTAATFSNSVISRELASGSTVTLNRTAGYVLVIFEFDDTGGASAFPDTDASEITQADLVYKVGHIDTASRLFGGKSLTSGVEAGYDTTLEAAGGGYGGCT